MKIKLFENFDEKLYSEVSSWERNPEEDFMKRMVEISIPISNQILNSIDRKGFEMLRLPVMDRDFTNNKFFKYSYIIVRPLSSLPWDDEHIKLEIYEDFDEYYWVKMETAGEDLFFKCDQVDGLLELLKDYNIAKKI
jgi:hypothetical protein